MIRGLGGCVVFAPSRMNSILASIFSSDKVSSCLCRKNVVLVFHLLADLIHEYSISKTQNKNSSLHCYHVLFLPFWEFHTIFL